MTASPWQQLSAWADSWADYMLAALVDATVGLVVVLAIWLLVRRRLSARWCYLLFLLVPLKTLIPIETPLLPAVTAQQSEATGTHPLLANAEQPVASPPRAHTPLPSSHSARATGTNREAAADQPATVTAAVHPSRTAVLMLVWAAIVVVLLGRLVWNQCCLLSRLKNAQRAVWDGHRIIPVAEFAGSGARESVPLLISPRIDVPAVVGLLRPRIVLPAGLVATLPERHIACIIAHELSHLRWRDIWVALLERLVRIVHFANPALWLAAHGMHVYREMACDDASLEASGMDRRACGATLLGVLEFAHRQQHPAAPAIAMFERARFQQRRLRRIMTTHATTRGMGWWSSLLLVAAVILVLPNLRPALPAPPTADPAAGDDLRTPRPGQEAGAAEPEQPDVLITIAQGGPISEQDYDISDLARSPADVEDLTYLITDSVMREDWSSVGGVGTIEPDNNARRLHIRQSAGAQAGVQQLLAGLRTAIRRQAATASGGVYAPPRGIGLFRHGEQILRLYTVPSLLHANPAVRDLRTADYDELIRVTTGVVGPDSWDDVGGPGTIHVWPPGSCVIISQSADDHTQIERLYAALHALPALNSGDQPATWEAVSLAREAMTFLSKNVTFDMETKLYALHDLLPTQTSPAFDVSPRAMGIQQLTAWLWKQAGLQGSQELVGLNRFRTKGALILTMQPAMHRRVADSLADLRNRVQQARTQDERVAILGPVFAPAFCTFASGFPSFPQEDASPNHIYLHGACGADEQLAQLERLSNSVYEVQLIDADVTDQGLETLSQFGMLRSLTIWSDRVTDAGVARLAAFNWLNDLALHSTQVTDDAVVSLARLQSVNQLDLSHTSITDEGLKMLVELCSDRQFMQLDVSHTKVSPAAVQSLRAACPHWRIVY